MLRFDPRAADRVLIAFVVGFLLAGGYAFVRSVGQGYSGELAGASLFFLGMFCGVQGAIASTLASMLRPWFDNAVRATLLRVLLSGVGAAAMILLLISLNVGRPYVLSALGFIGIVGTISAGFAWIAEAMRPSVMPTHRTGEAQSGHA